MRFGCDFQLKEINSALTLVKSVDQTKSNLAVNCSQTHRTYIRARNIHEVCMYDRSKIGQLEHSNRQGSAILGGLLQSLICATNCLFTCRHVKGTS